MNVEIGHRSRVVDLSRPGGAIRVELDAAEAAELLMSISCVCSDSYEAYELGEQRLQEVRAAIDSQLLADVTEIAGTNGKVLARLLGLVYETPSPRSFPAFLRRLEAAEPLELQLLLLGYRMRGYHLTVPHETILAAAQGDAAARARLLEVTADWPQDQGATETLLRLGGAGLQRRLLTLLPRWHEQVFRPLAAEAMGAVERDAAARRELVATHSVEELVELITSGVQYTPGPEVRRVAFFPTYWLRPWVMLNDHKDVKVFCYPAGEPVATGEEPEPAQLARLFKALGDEGRLRILKGLSEGPLALGEAADLLGVAKSTAHHHLAVLRSAGLVFVRDEPERVYTLRADVLPSASALLDAFLRPMPR
jgi:DNA-binding transcriptional ArsR family regulator